MRTDVKIIAVVVAVVIAVGGVWYFFYHQPKNRKPAPTAEVAKVQEPRNLVERPAGTSIDSGYGGTTDSGTGPGSFDMGRLDRLPGGRDVVPPETTYAVKSGDTYRSIALAKYGDPGMEPALRAANPGITPDRLRPGVTLKLPPTTTGPAVARTGSITPGTTSLDPISGKRFYVVKAGDNGFSAVAKKVYGDERQWRLIEEANPGVKSNLLRENQKLWVPERPMTATAPSRPPTGVDTAARHDRVTPAAPGSRTGGTPTAHVRTGAPVHEGAFD